MNARLAFVSRNGWVSFFGLAVLWSGLAFAHAGHEHKKKVEIESGSESVSTAKADVLALVANSYQSQVKHMFQSKCFDCHSNHTQYPWYYKFPGVKTLIDHDVTEGREHLDFSNDFPFGGHGSPVEDLDAIMEAVDKHEMPPPLYRLMHPESRLNDEEKARILDWVRTSQKVLKSGK